MDQEEEEEEMKEWRYEPQKVGRLEDGTAYQVISRLPSGGFCTVPVAASVSAYAPPTLSSGTPKKAAGGAAGGAAAAAAAALPAVGVNDCSMATEVDTDDEDVDDASLATVT